MSFHIVLVEPEIPQNTGNIGRTCYLTGAQLHLVRPLGFTIDDRKLKRAGIDYWEQLQVQFYDSFEELRKRYPEGRFFCATTRGSRIHTEYTYQEGDFFVFGKETKGLPKQILSAHSDTLVRIPLLPRGRSLNLGNAVSVLLYEGFRQLQFPNLI